MSTSGSKSNEHVAHFLVDIHNYPYSFNEFVEIFDAQIIED